MPIKTLTAEQTAALDRYRARWLAIRRSTEPADRDAAEEGVRLAYRAAGLQPPLRLVWCDSPVALAQRASRASCADGPNVKSAVIDRLRRLSAARVRKRLRARLRAQIESAVNPADPLIIAVAEAIMQGTAQESASLLECLRRSRPLSLSRFFGALASPRDFRDSAAGPRELSWLGVYEFMRNVLGLKEETAQLVGLTQLAINAGWLQPHERTCWLAERPCILRRDARDRLHDARGPALRFPDGWAVFAWRDVEVPRWLIEAPEKITLAAIDAESNVQVRRCMIEIMTPARFVALGGAARISEDETGVLWRKTWLLYDAWAAVEVINATPEPDGTHKHFFLQVPANLRSAREAVAWTYGMRADDYSQLVVRT